ncbi:nuclear transport factor 2 family protein [Polyangium mundeleinium]|uniref:Nuclear transport factor 2 family protein n=1 Tax=Polyangium mundeleinium TaxID=2995306 RepID=A0ABT5EHT7_9BACT|nr:nuclear transport factor 2 family protein [Polyangium mundeleinium]MDC0740487.1 nuclear transport factor 2 family protein [Polyangium mundeleinium]
MIKTSFTSVGRRAKVALTVAGAAAAVALFAGFITPTPNGWKLAAELEIAKLPVCYALGTDAIGRGDLQAGKNIYAPCFKSDTELAVYFPGTPFTGPPSSTAVGANAWADFVEGVFTTSGYTSTQHLIGSIDINVIDEDEATMTSYLHATHVLPDGTIDVANGTYEDEVIRVNGAWKIKRRTLKLITFLNLGTPTP